jgi:hypothetical protein
MKLYHVTYLLLALLFVAVSISAALRKNNSIRIYQATEQHSDVGQKARDKQREAELRNNYLTVDFNEQETADPAKRATQKARKQRHNNAAIVSKTPSPKDREVASLPEGLFDFPGLPVAESDLVVLADVNQAEAHMSEDQGNVYTEFELHLLEVFRSNVQLLPGQSITAERQGGYVRYPGNQKILYRVVKNGMLRIGGRYLLFLRAIPKTDVYRILTGYEIGPQAVSPVDISAQFEIYRGNDEASFLKTVRETVLRTSQP